MTRTFWTFALCASLCFLDVRAALAGGRGGGRQSGGGGYGGGMQRGGEGGMKRGGEEGGMSHSPSFSQPRSESNGSGNGNRNSNNSNAGAAAAGAGYANKNQSPNHSNAGAAAVGAGASNKNNTNSNPNAGAAAAGADYANKNPAPNHPNAAPAAVGAGYANRNNTSNNHSNAGAAALGANYANTNNGANAYGMGGGSWNGNYGNGSMGSYGGMGMASPSYGYGSSPYVNPYASGGSGQPQPANLPANNAPATPSSYDYTQPVNPSAVDPVLAPPADPSTAPAAQALQAFQTGDYPGAVLLTQQALAQTPNDLNLHQFLALSQFAQGNYDQAAPPLYAVLAVGPGWNWTSLISNYTDAGAYTTQLRSLETFVNTNPRSAQAQFVLAYLYISEGQQDAAIKPLKAVVALQPSDRISAQLLDKLQPPTAASPALQPLDSSKLLGVWVAQAPQNATFTLTIADTTNFTWGFAGPGKPPVTIRGTYAVNNGVLTLSGINPPGAPLAGQVALIDDNHLSFKAVNASSGDPGLPFAR